MLPPAYKPVKRMRVVLGNGHPQNLCSQRHIPTHAPTPVRTSVFSSHTILPSTNRRACACRTPLLTGASGCSSSPNPGDKGASQAAAWPSVRTGGAEGAPRPALGRPPPRPARVRGTGPSTAPPSPSPTTATPTRRLSPPTCRSCQRPRYLTERGRRRAGSGRCAGRGLPSAPLRSPGPRTAAGAHPRKEGRAGIRHPPGSRR